MNPYLSITNSLLGGSAQSTPSYIKNPQYDPGNVNSKFYVSGNDIASLGMNPVDSKLEQYSGKNTVSSKLTVGANQSLQSLFGAPTVSPAWQNALKGYSIGANGQLQAPTTPQQPATQTSTPTPTATGRATTITAPQYTPPSNPATPSYDPSVTGQPIDTTRLSGAELKDLATRAGQAGLSLSDYVDLVNQNAQISSKDDKAIRDNLGIDAQTEKVFSAPKESLEQVYRNLYKEVGLGDIKDKIAEIDASLNQKRADFTKVEGEIKNNPWLSSASRRGRLANAAELALADIGNDLDARQQYLDLYSQGVGELESRLGYIVSDRNLTREIDTEKLNYLLSEAERQAGLQVKDNVAAGLRNVPDFLQGRRDEQLRIEANDRAMAQAKIAASAQEVPVLRLDETGNIVAGSEPPKAPNTSERQGLIFFQRMADAMNNLKELEDETTNLGFLGQLNLNYGNSLTQGQDLERISQAQRAFTEARLRKDSGAAIPPEEFESDKKTYFPQPGDTEAVIKQKAESREVALNALRVASGNAYWELYGVSPVEETIARLSTGAGALNPTGGVAATEADNAYVGTLNLK